MKEKDTINVICKEKKKTLFNKRRQAIILILLLQLFVCDYYLCEIFSRMKSLCGATVCDGSSRFRSSTSSQLESWSVLEEEQEEEPRLATRKLSYPSRFNEKNINKKMEKQNRIDI